MTKIKRALISVSDKEGLMDFAKGLEKLGIEIISTGGTAQLLKDAQIRVKLISEVTNFPEILDGRVKTLHPLIFGGLLAKSDNPSVLPFGPRLTNGPDPWEQVNQLITPSHSHDAE